MLEVLKLRFINKILNRRQKEGNYLLFIPQDQRLREISEALLIDGAAPSEINSTILDIWKEEHIRTRPNILNRYQPVREVQYFAEGSE